MIHHVKILPIYFEAVKEGKKNFELRFNDRGYEVGDFLLLEEWDNGKYTGRKHERKIKCKLENFEGIQEGYCILGF